MHKPQVKIIEASVSENNIPIVTFQLRYWRAIHSELMTHRVFSRNAGSSRARPSSLIIEQVRNDPWGPNHWGSNKPGMQAGEPLNEQDVEAAKDLWREAARQAADYAQALLDLGAHKQIVNRILEPFTYIDVVLTATDFNNWFALRNHPDAQPEIQELAKAMFDELQQAHENNSFKLLIDGEWHLPYVTQDDWKAAELRSQSIHKSDNSSLHDEVLDTVLAISVARCARVSYKAFDGSQTSIENDLELYQKLLGSQPLHASPAEHQATPDYLIPMEWDRDKKFSPGMEKWAHSHLHGNFRGWIQYRKTLPGEYVEG